VAEKIILEVVTPERRVVHAEVVEVTAPGLLGEFGVLPGHAAFLTATKPGVVTYRTGPGTGPEVLAVSDGFVEVAEDRVTLLVNSSEPAGEIDRARAEAARERAERRLRELPADHPEVADAQAAILRAQARLGASTRELH
jgi:F-type H+-transporting ATPase subunit epsilon